MGRLKDLTGCVFGKWTVLRIDDSNPKNKRTNWICQCGCGNIVSVNAYSLKSGASTQCRLCSRISSAQTRRRKYDISGQRFGRLVALHYSHSQKAKGNYTDSCWSCLCDCGNVVTVKRKCLVHGYTRSCGCYRSECRERVGRSKSNDISGKRYGKLTALYPTEERMGTAIIWHCICDCGTECDLPAYYLNDGRRDRCKECFTSVSKGERRIYDLLEGKSISFEREKRFDNCRYPLTNAMLIFDFYVANQYIIEYDGSQHYKPNSLFNRDMSFEECRDRDRYKNEWCFKHDVPIIRIPYTHYNKITIEDLTPETSPFLLCKNQQNPLVCQSA